MEFPCGHRDVTCGQNEWNSPADTEMSRVAKTIGLNLLKWLSDPVRDS